MKDPAASRDCEEEDQQPSGGGKKFRHRKRHKAAYKALMEQMEFYFSDANLSKSKFMTEKLEKSPWINLDVFLAFNKLREMLACSVGDDPKEQAEFLWKAVSILPSELLDTKEEDGVRAIKRKVAFKPRKDDDECTLYVEKIPSQFGSIETLREAFSQYGKVVYVSLPKYKKSGAIKGFAFVQFEKADSAARALEAFGFGEEKAKEMDPAELDSIKSFQNEQMEELEKRKEEATAVDVKEEDDSGEPPNKKSRDGDPEEDDETKKKRKKNRQHKPLPGSSVATELKELKLGTLRIMSKACWKWLRNRYLNQQRKNMSQSKKRLREWRQNQETAANKQEAPSKSDENGHKDADNAAAAVEVTVVPNTIVKFELKEPISNKQLVKGKVRSAFMDPVSYVDADVGLSEYFVRCADEAQAKRLAGVASLGKATILAGGEETAYWEKIRKQRQEKRDKGFKKASQQQQQQQRGRERVISKAEEMKNSHTYFGDDDEGAA